MKRAMTLSALLLAAAATGCSSGAGANDDVMTVGLLVPSSGPFAGLAEDQEAGLRHYIENVVDNQFGEYEVEIVTADEGTTPDVARKSVVELVEGRSVDAIVGIISSANAYAISPYLSEQGVPTILSATAADDLTQREDVANIFRVASTASQVMLPVGEFACTELGYKTATMVSLDYSFGWESMGGFAKSYTDAGCKIEQEVYTPLGTENWGSVVQSIDTNVDLIVQTTTGLDAVKLLRAYQDYGLSDIPMIANGWGTDPSSLSEQKEKKLAVPIKSVHYYAEASEDPANVEFTSSYREAYGDTPGAYVEAAYTAGIVLDEAVQSAASLDSEALVEAISEVSIDDTPRGHVEFDDYGQVSVPIHLREMVKVDGELMNKNVRTISKSVSQFGSYDPDEAMDEKPFIDLKGTWAE